MTPYLSGPDRRAETELAEDRIPAALDAPELHAALERTSCRWCRRPVVEHSVEALALCEQRFETELNRRRAGPVRVGDLAGRLA